jgi:hypothetical protein
LTLEVVPAGGGDPQMYALGPHPPQLWPSDVELVHELWQELSERPDIGARLHHRDIVGVALRRLNEELHSRRAHEVFADVEKELTRPREAPVKESAIVAGDEDENGPKETPVSSGSPKA